MGWKIDIAAAATHKYAVSKSGDVVEVVERPGGGYGVVLADGQGSGPAGRAIARLVAGHASRLLQDGARAWVAAMAASDALLHARSGQVSAGLDVVAIDPGLDVEVARFSSNQIVVWSDGAWKTLQRSGEPAGRLQEQSPEVESIPMADGLIVVLATDGITQAGSRFGMSFDLLDALQSAPLEHDASVLCRRLLDSATSADRGRPQDDLTVVAIMVNGAASDQRVQRLHVSDVWR